MQFSNCGVVGCQITFESFSFLGGRSNLIEVDDSATKTLHGHSEGTTSASRNLIKHRGEDFTLLNIHKEKSINQ